MPFKFQIVRVEYEGRGDDATTVLYGSVVEGELVGPESICLETRSGTIYRFGISSLGIEGSQAPPIRPEHNCSLSLGVSGHPPDLDILVPSVGVADGH